MSDGISDTSTNYLWKEESFHPNQANRLVVIRKVYEHQKFLYDSGTHSVPNRIVSIIQPYIRPIVRSKAKTRRQRLAPNWIFP